MLRKLRNQQSFFNLGRSSGSVSSRSESLRSSNSGSRPVTFDDSESQSREDSNTIPSLDRSMSESSNSSSSSFSFSPSPLSFVRRNADISYDDISEPSSFVRRNADISYDDIDEAVNQENFSRPLSVIYDEEDDDMFSSSFEGSETLHEQIEDLCRRLEDSERARQNLITQCLKLQKRVAGQAIKESTPTYLSILKRENDKLKADKARMENEFANDVKILLNRMNELDLKLVNRNVRIKDLEYELEMPRAEAL